MLKTGIRMTRDLVETETPFRKTSHTTGEQVQLGRGTYIVEDARSRRGGERVQKIVRGEGAQEAGDLRDHCALPFLGGIFGCIVVPREHGQADVVRQG